MEQKKILWIVLSVSLFLVVVLGIGLIWLRPVENPSIVTDGSLPGAGTAGTGFDAIEYIREGENFPGLEAADSEASSEDFVAVPEEIYIGARPADASRAGDAPVSPGRSPETVTVSPRANAGSGSSGQGSGAAVSTPVQVPSASGTGTKPAAGQSSGTPRVQTPAPAPKPVKEYWIQAAAFESNTRANEVKDQLSAKGFAPVISTRSVEGKTFFRVRLGPYPNESEANKFLGWVKAIDGFSSAWVSEVTVTR